MNIIYEYTKKPVRVEAALFNGDKHTTERILQWVGNNIDIHTEGETPRIIADFDPLSETYKGLHIFTLEGTMRAEIGDYIIKGIQGEFYPCKPDIFEDTYERA